jgi:predicted NAD/FAD-binding protein
VVLGAGSTLLPQCGVQGQQQIPGSIVGANSKAGHLLTNQALANTPATQHLQTDTLIIGGGVSGLSAARWLHKHGYTNFLLAELDNQTGGNAASGQNALTAYPWGAHYIPLPNNDLTAYLQFLQECGVITGYENNLPLINEFYLCFEPQERLYINGHWQDGLIPHFGNSPDEDKQAKQFFALIDTFKTAIGKDGKAAFAIPASTSSTDSRFTSLDAISMQQWMHQNNFTAAPLHWYINYCCRDDFGTDYSKTSAWAGIHYFASRKGKAANAPSQAVITWPQGNAFLASALKKDMEPNILTNTAALSVQQQGQWVTVKTIDTITQKISSIQCRQCIIATPQFVAVRLLADEQRKKMVAAHCQYYPWMVANIYTKKLTERKGAALSWDNVLYNGRGLGYIESTHQQVKQPGQHNVLTYYLPLTHASAKQERQKAYKNTHADWVTLLQNDLQIPHPDFNQQAIQADIWVWGHGMISPAPGYIHGNIRQQLQQPINNRVFFAHSDLAGISIFEEAFYQGINAAQQIIQSV